MRTSIRHIRQRWRLAIAITACLAALVVWNQLAIWLAVLLWFAFLLITATPHRPSGPATLPVAQTAGQPLPSFEALLATIPDAVVILDASLIIRQFNSGACAIVPNLRIGEALPFAVRSPALIDAVRLAAETATNRMIEYTERVPVERHIETRIAPIAAPDGQTRFVVMLIRDITQQRRIEQMRADFIANASHELRTPLASLLGFIETLQGTARNDELARDKFLEIMRAQARRMARLIDDLLSLARIELNAHIRPAMPVDLCAIVSHVSDTLAPLARERGVKLTIDMQIASLIVTGDNDELIRVFENLVENAIKYGASGGRVDITVTARHRTGGGSEAAVTVRDYGPGIEAEHVPRLTERFYRVDTDASRSIGGTGLGLAIVKHILSRHHARLLISSIPGEGASFCVVLEATKRHDEKY